MIKRIETKTGYVELMVGNRGETIEITKVEHYDKGPWDFSNSITLTKPEINELIELLKKIKL